MTAYAGGFVNVKVVNSDYRLGATGW